MNPVDCSNCGAKMHPGPDGRVYVCGYCNTQVQVALAGDQIAAGMRLDLANVEMLLAQLANTLSQGFSEHTRIHAEGRVVHVIEVDVDPDRFAIRREHGGVVAEHKKMVRGVALKTTKLPLDKWVHQLSEALARAANENARAAWVLSQLGGHR